MRYRVSEEKVAWRIVDGEGVLLHADTSAYFGLNRIGTLLWTELARRTTGVDDLAAWTRQRLPDAPAELPRDIATFLEQLKEHDLLDLVSEGETGDRTAPRAVEAPALDGFRYEPPQLLRFGELEKLILSGE